MSCQSSGGREFHTLSPTLLWVRGTTQALSLADCSRRRPLSATSWTSSARYWGACPDSDLYIKQPSFKWIRWRTYLVIVTCDIPITSAGLFSLWLKVTYQLRCRHTAVTYLSLLQVCFVSGWKSRTNSDADRQLWLTYHFCRFVLSLVDKVLEGLLHDVDKLLVLVETHGDDVV